MNYHELKIIVSEIKKMLRCPGCDGKYTDENIDVLGDTSFGESIFHAYCPACNDESCVHVGADMDIVQYSDPRLGTAPRMEKIESDEVLDMHNYLKGFGGNFSETFKEESKNPQQ